MDNSPPDSAPGSSIMQLIGDLGAKPMSAAELRRLCSDLGWSVGGDLPRAAQRDAARVRKMARGRPDHIVDVGLAGWLRLVHRLDGRFRDDQEEADLQHLLALGAPRGLGRDA